MKSDPKLALTEETQLFDVIKLAMRRRKLRYRDLAEKTGMSESGLKKIFAAKDCSLSKLLNICKALDVSLAELVEQSNKIPLKSFVLNSMQEDFFLENIEIFWFYWLLVYERRDLKDIARGLNLKPNEVSRHLTSLDELKLIELTRDNQVKLPSPSFIRWHQNPRLAERVFPAWSQQLIEKAFASDGYYRSLNFYYLSEDAIAKIHTLLSELATNILSLADSDRKFSDQSTNKLFSIGIYSASGTLVPDWCEATPNVVLADV